MRRSRIEENLELSRSPKTYKCVETKGSLSPPIVLSPTHSKQSTLAIVRQHHSNCLSSQGGRNTLTRVVHTCLEDTSILLHDWDLFTDPPHFFQEECFGGLSIEEQTIVNRMEIKQFYTLFCKKNLDYAG